MRTFRLSAEGSDHLMEKQMASYSVLIDTAEGKGGNAAESPYSMLYLSHSI